HWAEGAPMLAWWQRCAEFLSPATTPLDEAVLRFSAPPAQLKNLVGDVQAAVSAAEVGARLAAHAGNGVLFARLQGEHLTAALPALFADLATRWQAITLLAAPLDAKHRLDVWGPPPAGFPLMQRIKEQFDPQSTLNPGRFLGRL
ncbi:MAG TPA: FAD-linked oxidase C-terminal domain-containing protein, partial [Chloroflexota bacterium]